MLLIFVKSQLSLFDTPVHIAAHVRKDGTVVKPHIRIQKVAVKQPSLFGEHHAAPEPVARPRGKLHTFLARHGGAEGMAAKLRAFSEQQQAALLEQMAKVGGMDVAEVRKLLGVGGPVAAPVQEVVKPVREPLATGVEPQKNGAVLVLGDAAKLESYGNKHLDLDVVKYKLDARGLMLPKAKARMAEFFPSEREVLPSGAYINHYSDGGASVSVGREISGVARNVAELKELVAEDWGAEKFQQVFGESASAEAAQAHADAQAAIEQRVRDHEAAKVKASEDAKRAEDEAAAAKQAEKDETARVLAEDEANRRAQIEATLHQGNGLGNTKYQAFLDTLENPAEIGYNHANFMGWVGHRRTEFESKHGNIYGQEKQEAFDQYVREYADAHLSERVKAKREQDGPHEGERNAEGLVFRDGRWHREDVEQAAPVEAAAEESAPAHDIIEHVTGKGKTLRGIIRTDIDGHAAAAIDPYTFKKNGGWFIREKHLTGATGAAPAAAAEPAAEVDAEAQARAQAAAAVEKSKAQAAKLREAGEKLLAESEAHYQRDRLTNTARRVRFAAAAERAAQDDIRIAQTMINLASAIEDGDARHMAGVSSKAAVVTLEKELQRTIYTADKHLSYTDQQRQRGRDATDEDISKAEILQPKWHESAGATVSGVLDAIKGKRGAPALAAKLRYSEGPTPEVAVELRKIVSADQVKSLLGWWNVERLQEINRLQKLGITNNEQLREALREFVQYRGGHKPVDPIKAAERALVGQKVGVDFFPTPKTLAAAMAQAAGIKAGMRVLEPSAGNGHLADAAKEAGADVDAVEISDTLRNILQAKGHNLAGRDFESFEPAVKYDAVLMNPPFSDRKDAAHIMRAMDMVKPGGKLIAIAGEGVFFGSDKKAVAFREWLAEHGAEVEQLPAGTFMGADLPVQTGANARLIKMTKAGEVVAPTAGTSPAAETGPKDGDRNAEGLVFRNGRWHREDEQEQAAETAATVDDDAASPTEQAKPEQPATDADLAEDREDLATELTRNPHSDKAKAMLAEVAEKHAKTETVDSMDEDDPSSAAYRYADTGYVAGSRKEQAAANVIARAKRDGAQVMVQHIDWEGMEANPREAKELITKSNLFGVVPWATLRDNGMEPGAGFIIDRIYAAIGTEPTDDNAQARKDYTVGLQTLRNRLEACKTVQEVADVLDDLQREYDGKILNAEESAAYAKVQEAKKPISERLKAIGKERDAKYAAANALALPLREMEDKQSNRKRRGWKPDAELDAQIAALKPKVEAARAAYGEALRTFNKERDELESQYRTLYAMQDRIEQGAFARNKIENPLHRAWGIMGERFVNVLRYRKHKGSEAFLNHMATAKAGGVKDWSWSEKDGATKAPKVKKESVRFQMKVADSYKRKGGRDIKPESTLALKKQFGLRDVQSGNWVLRDEVSAKFHVEQSAAAMADLADLIGIPDEQVSFNGRLALAFGARGRGNAGGASAAAHYEPVHRVINMTKMAGGGALAHEIFHAWDNMVKEAMGGDKAGTEDFASERPDLVPEGPLRDAFKALRSALHDGEHQAEQEHTYSAADYALAKRNMTPGYYGLSGVAKQINAAGNLGAALDVLDKLFDGRGSKKNAKAWRTIAIAHYGGSPDGGVVVAKSGPKMSSFKNEAMILDGGSKKDYYSEGREMSARAFQSWVEDRLAGMGRQNDYLSWGADNKYHRDPLTGMQWKPFPEGEERERINKAFDNLMAAMSEQQVLAKAMALW